MFFTCPTLICCHYVFRSLVSPWIWPPSQRGWSWQKQPVHRAWNWGRWHCRGPTGPETSIETCPTAHQELPSVSSGDMKMVQNVILPLIFILLQSSIGILLPGFLGDGDVVTQAIHDAQLLLRSHGAGGREREREMARDKDGRGRMVS